jgi:hypothetical protein
MVASLASLSVLRGISWHGLADSGPTLASIGGIETLATHYARLLGTDDSWRVEAVDLRLKDHRIESRLKHVGSGISYPDCGR